MWDSGGVAGRRCMHVCTYRLYPAKRVESITAPLFLISMNHYTQRETEGGTDRQTDRDRKTETETKRQRETETVTATDRDRNRGKERRQKTHVVPLVLTTSSRDVRRHVRPLLTEFSGLVPGCCTLSR